MSEHLAFMRSICESPDDDSPRLVYADWLDEHDEPGRAEFIRLQCKIEPVRNAIIIDEDSRLIAHGPRCWEWFTNPISYFSRKWEIGDRISLLKPVKLAIDKYLKPKFGLRLHKIGNHLGYDDTNLILVEDDESKKYFDVRPLLKHEEDLWCSRSSWNKNDTSKIDIVSWTGLPIGSVLVSVDPSLDFIYQYRHPPHPPTSNLPSRFRDEFYGDMGPMARLEQTSLLAGTGEVRAVQG